VAWKYARADDRAGSGHELSYIETLNDAARSLRDVLDFLLVSDDRGDGAASDVRLSLISVGVNEVGVSQELEKIVSITEKAMAEKRKGGRPRENIELEVLMTRVARMFETATERKAAITTSRYPDRDRYSGDFFRLAELVDIAAAAATHREPLSNGALGRLLTRIQKAAEALKPHNPH
jgi:hypothetical protein